MMYEDEENHSIDQPEEQTCNKTEIDDAEFDESLAEKEVEEIVVKPKKRGMGRFVIGLVIISLVGGTAIGSSFALVSSYMNEHYLSEQSEIGAVAGIDINTSSRYENGILPIVQNGSIAEIANNVGPAVVSIYNNQKITPDMFYYYFYGQGSNDSEVLSGIGSGIVFKEDEEKLYIVTNSHVVEGADSLAVNFLGDIKAEAKLIGQDTTVDIAVVSVDKGNLSEEDLKGIGIATFGDSDQIQVGDLSVAIGTPMEEALNNTVTAGIISAVHREVSMSDGTKELIQTDAAINPGNSGGALVGPTGEVIGINVAKIVANGTEGIGFAIPINTAKPIIAEILEYGTIIRPGLGITGSDVTAQASELYDLPIGILINSVITGGSADLAGLKPYDILFEFDGTKITSMEQLKALLSNKRVGDRVEVKVIRDNKKKVFQVELKAMPSISRN